MRGYCLLVVFLLVPGVSSGARETSSPVESEVTREIDAALRDGDVSLAWTRFVNGLLGSLDNVQRQLILFDKGIEICLMENQPQLADDLFLTAKSIGLLQDPRWKIRGLMRKAEIQFSLGNFHLMNALNNKVTSLLHKGTSEVELSNLFGQRAMYAWLTHQHAAANEYIEAVLFNTEDDEASKPRAIALMIMAFNIGEQGKEDSLIDLNLELSRKIFVENSNTIGYYSLLSRFLQLFSGHSIRTLNDAFLRHMQHGDRFDSNYIKSVAMIAHGELHRRQNEFEQAVDLLQRSEEYGILAHEEIESREVDWRRIQLQYFTANEPVETNVFPIYWVIITMLLIVLMLLLLLRTRTQRMINENLLESVEKARLAEQAAEHANQLKSQFVSNVSHEIKAPMSGLVGMTSILEELIKDPVQRKYLTTIRECSRNLLVLMNDLLDLGRIDADKLDIELSEIVIKETINYCEQIIRVRTSEKGLQFVVTCSPDLPARIISDPTRLSQIILNLLNNAVQFTDKGKIDLSVGFERTIGKGGNLMVVVSDTGRGIEPNRLQTVFEPFNQVAQTDDGKGTGSGLGLAISKRLADHMGGTLSVESELGEGAAFTLSLPVQLPENSGNDDP